MGIDPSLGEKGMMVSRLGYPSFFKNDNPICPSKGSDPMGN
jgi:hypothetical protein